MRDDIILATAVILAFAVALAVFHVPGWRAARRLRCRALLAGNGAWGLAVLLLCGLVGLLLTHGALSPLDSRINGFFGAYRTSPLIDIFLWLTVLGAGPAAGAVAVTASGFLLAARQVRTVMALWIVFGGATATAWLLKYLVGRVRPPFLEMATATSPSFPSAHATAAIAVYGFVAFAIARQFPDRRHRFEIAFWAVVLIALIGFSRIFLSLHYTTDVVAGFLVGGLWLSIGFALASSTPPR